MGGRVAGMSAAAVLAGRGYAVTLLERGPALGGKLSGWPLRVLGEDVPMEHGFHGFFRQYYNLRALLAEAGADRDLRPLDAYAVLVRGRPVEAFGAGGAPFPLDLLQVLQRSPSLSLADVAGDRPGMRELLAYDPVRTFARWDALDVDAFVREGRLEGTFAELVLRPFGQASMNGLSRFSAAEAIRFFHFYMLGNPEGLGFDALARGVGPAVLAPLRAHLERLGVAVRTGAEVRAVPRRGPRRRVVLAAAGAPATVLAAAAVPEAGWADAGAAFVRRTAAGYEARDVRCTHLGCPVQRAPDGFRCPCHAGRYDLDGVPVSGPPPRPLATLPVAVDGDVLRIGGAAAGDEVVPADAVVLALDSRGLRALCAAGDLPRAAPRLAAAAAASGEADPYAVVRLWLDRPVDPARLPFYTVAGWPDTDSLAVYSAFQAPYVDWAARTGGAVVESHAYAIEPERRGSPDVLRDRLLAELRDIFPELAGAAVRHDEAMVQDDFTRFAPGDAARRPTVASDVPNLVVAGDHVQLPFPAFLMEAAAASGRLAANHLLAADGVREVPIPTVSWRGPLADVLS
ncbi:MAG: FAD-dependent oxidoreductase [Myxococcota bacterium]